MTRDDQAQRQRATRWTIGTAEAYRERERRRRLHADILGDVLVIIAWLALAVSAWWML